MAWDSIEDSFANLRRREMAHWKNYLGFYSSYLGGYFREPWAMLMPIDDHGFHRGDGVFEAVRIHARAYIDLEAHLKRIERSAAAIGMMPPKSRAEMAAIVLELARRTNADTGILRLYITRGPGGFSPNPAEVTGHQIYAAITAMRPPDPKLYADGCRAMFATIPAKEPFWSQIKSCNYLQNVLMKMETVQKGFDFSVSHDPSGRLAEGSTENILVVRQDGSIVVPKFDYTLRGTTVCEVLRIAQSMGMKAELADVSREDLIEAREAAFVGTTLGVLPIASINGQNIGSGRAGEVCTRLNQRLMEKMLTDPNLRSAF